jgi:hypothetical protein|tara:strand:- start:651 stop:980 length:330 start_codon:yes stop_codon:yes gene_type:complete
MSLKDQLLQKGSNGTKWDGAQPPQNVGTTKQSLLHADGGNEKYGYSTGGDYFPQVNDAANSYDNGNSFPLPIPSQLDMANGAKINAPQYNHKQRYDWRSGQGYLDNLPG